MVKPKILFIYSNLAGQGYYRCFLPATLLFHNQLAEIKLSNKLFKDEVEWADLVVLNASIPSIEMMYKFKEMKKKVIFDIDDAILKTPDHTKHAFYVNPDNKKRVNILLKNVDAITVTTKRLREEYIGFNDNVYILPNSFNFEDHKEDMELMPQKSFDSNTQLRICWQGGFVHYDDLKIIEEVLVELFSKYGKKLFFIAFGWAGNWEKRSRETRETIDSGNLFKNIPSYNYKYVQMSIFNHFFKVLRALDVHIGLAPLDSTLVFNECKSPLKWLDYTCVKAMTIASNVGPYKEIEHGVNGLKFDKPEEILDYIGILLSNPELINTFAAKSLEHIKEQYDIQKNISLWMDAYNEVLDAKD